MSYSLTWLGKRSVSFPLGPGPHPAAPHNSWVPDLLLVMCCVLCVWCLSTGVTHMHCPYVGVQWVPAHVLWDTGYGLCRPQGVLVECPALPVQPERQCCLAGPGLLLLRPQWVCVPVWLPPTPCQLLPGIWAAWAWPFPSQSEGGRGGCLAGLPLAEAQVQAVLKAPPPPSKLGRQENTRHSCAKVAAGRQAVGGGGRGDGGLEATGPKGGLHARLASAAGQACTSV